MGSVTKDVRANGRGGRKWTGRWRARYRDPLGVERTRLFPEKADAEAFIVTTEADIRRGDWRDPDHARVTFAEWHARWWSTVERSERAANTLVQYENLLRRHVLPHLGARRLSTLRASTSRNGSPGCAMPA